MTSIHSWPFSWLSLIALQVDASVMEGSVCTYMGNSMTSLMGSEAAILAKVSLTFVRYHAMCSSLAPHSSCTCLTTS